MPKTILCSIGAACLIALCALIATCRPAPTQPAEATTSSTSAGASGAGGAAGPAESSAASATATAATGAPGPSCEVRQVKHTACDNPGDCFDSSQCTDDLCDLSTPPSPPDPYGRRGTCRWTQRPDGAACDVSDLADACRSGVCCPPGVLPPPGTPAVPAAPPATPATIVPLPQVR
ncbi:hypothetical protein [Sorangium sp. So ce388]|uniref:hypothetical protein n=1 Tax=Sorangium sp. So ce388 TaxID=3133309 RepID=UPI003F5B2870